MKIELKTNVFNIPERLRDIDDGYFVMFDTTRQKYEVHNKYNRGGSYCLTVPHDELDARTIDLVQQTRLENAKKIIEEFEKQEAYLHESNRKQWNDYIETSAKELFKYGQHKAGEARLIEGV
jgi:hypothetical protein